VLEQIQQFTPVDDTLAAFISQDDLLGKALLYFFHEIIRKDERVEKTQAALQREGLSIEVRELQTALKTAQDNLNQAVAEQSTQLAEIAQQLQDLQQAQSAWQSRSELLTPFPAWTELLNCQLDHLLDFVTSIPEQLEKVHQEVKKTKDLAEEILQTLKALMARQDLSSRVKPRDEFTLHNSKSLNQNRLIPDKWVDCTICTETFGNGVLILGMKTMRGHLMMGVFGKEVLEASVERYNNFGFRVVSSVNLLALCPFELLLFAFF